jgi:hypothetical protein
MWEPEINVNTLLGKTVSSITGGEVGSDDMTFNCEDIAHFCDILTTGPGNRIPTPTLRFEIRRDMDAVVPSQPHNALSDAAAMRDSVLASVHR